MRTWVRAGFLACLVVLAGAVASSQEVIDDLEMLEEPDQISFPPDVARDLVGQTRIAVELLFKGDKWKLNAARTEFGVPPSYPDEDGFIRVTLAAADDQVLRVVGTRDPRWVRSYRPSRDQAGYFDYLDVRRRIQRILGSGGRVVARPAGPQALSPAMASPPPQPVHDDKRLERGTAIIYLPDRPDACKVVLQVSRGTDGPWRATATVVDQEGRPRCRSR